MLAIMAIPVIPDGYIITLRIQPVMSEAIPISLTIAGSDSGGGAGIQADLKTFSALKTFGTSVITAITAQNSREVLSIHEVPVPVIHDQVRALATDFSISSFKTGMLFSREIIESLGKSIDEYQLPSYVLDPVMISKSGTRLLKDDAIEALREFLVPKSLVVTPNIPEAEVLTGISISDGKSAGEAARHLLEMGAGWVIIKGGHLEGEPVDRVYSKDEFFELPGKRVETRNTHGSGCTYSSAIVAFLARGYSPAGAIREAKTYIHGGIEQSLDIGSGHGPLHHFHPWYRF